MRKCDLNGAATRLNQCGWETFYVLYWFILYLYNIYIDRITLIKSADLTDRTSYWSSNILISSAIFKILPENFCRCTSLVPNSSLFLLPIKRKKSNLPLCLSYEFGSPVIHVTIELHKWRLLCLLWNDSKDLCFRAFLVEIGLKCCYCCCCCCLLC